MLWRSAQSRQHHHTCWWMLTLEVDGRDPQTTVSPLPHAGRSSHSAGAERASLTCPPRAKWLGFLGASCCLCQMHLYCRCPVWGPLSSLLVLRCSLSWQLQAKNHRTLSGESETFLLDALIWLAYYSGHTARGRSSLHGPTPTVPACKLVMTLTP